MSNPSSHLHLMVDIETLATHTHAPIIELAAVKFTPSGLLDTFTSHIAPIFTPPHLPDLDTISWWFAQISRNPMLSPIDIGAPSFPHVYNAFAGWLGASTFDGVWANDPSFDLAILNSHARTHSLRPLWSHHNERSYRTVMSLLDPQARAVIKSDNKSTTPHNALADATAQTQAIIQAYHHLGLRSVFIL